MYLFCPVQIPSLNMQIFLIGFMGSGKSFTGHQLARHLGREFIDLDELITLKEGRSVRAIFEQRGENYFRATEASTLRQTLGYPPAVIACGGGTPCFNDSMAWMNQNGLTIFLDTDPQVLFQRLTMGKAHRPLIRGMSDQELKQYIQNKLNEREPYYKQASIIYRQQTGEENVAAELAHQFTNIIGH